MSEIKPTLSSDNKLTGVNHGDKVIVHTKAFITKEPNTGNLIIKPESIKHEILMNDKVLGTMENGKLITAAGGTRRKRVNKKRGGRTKHKR